MNYIKRQKLMKGIQNINNYKYIQLVNAQKTQDNIQSYSSTNISQQKKINKVNYQFNYKNFENNFFNNYKTRKNNEISQDKNELLNMSKVVNNSKIKIKSFIIKNGSPFRIKHNLNKTNALILSKGFNKCVISPNTEDNNIRNKKKSLIPTLIKNPQKFKYLFTDTEKDVKDNFQISRKITDYKNFINKENDDNQLIKKNYEENKNPRYEILNKTKENKTESITKKTCTKVDINNINSHYLKSNLGNYRNKTRILHDKYFSPEIYTDLQSYNYKKETIKKVNKILNNNIDEFYLPKKKLNDKNKKTLVIDLDETLIHSSFKPYPFKPDLEFYINLDGQNFKIYVLIRPYVNNFLERMSKYYEIVIFTAGVYEYANVLLDKLNINEYVSYRLFRQHCISVKNVFIKDLNKIGRNLEDTIILDNNPISYFLNKENGLPIKSWHFDKTDKELVKLIPFLVYLASVNDVRPIIKEVVKNGNIDFEFFKNIISINEISDNKKILEKIELNIDNIPNNNKIIFNKIEINNKSKKDINENKKYKINKNYFDNIYLPQQNKTYIHNNYHYLTNNNDNSSYENSETLNSYSNVEISKNLKKNNLMKNSYQNYNNFGKSLKNITKIVNIYNNTNSSISPINLKGITTISVSNSLLRNRCLKNMQKLNKINNSLINNKRPNSANPQNSSFFNNDLTKNIYINTLNQSILNLHNSPLNFDNGNIESYESIKKQTFKNSSKDSKIKEINCNFSNSNIYLNRSNLFKEHLKQNYIINSNKRNNEIMKINLQKKSNTNNIYKRVPNLKLFNFNDSKFLYFNTVDDKIL